MCLCTNRTHGPPQGSPFCCPCTLPGRTNLGDGPAQLTQRGSPFSPLTTTLRVLFMWTYGAQLSKEMGVQISNGDGSHLLVTSPPPLLTRSS